LPDNLIFRNRVKPSSEKYFAFPEMKIGLYRCSSRPDRGRIAIVTKRGAGMRWTDRRARRARPVRTAKSRGPDLPTLGSTLRALKRARGRRWLKSPDTGENAYKP
jgi:hypothetical protein